MKLGKLAAIAGIGTAAAAAAAHGAGYMLFKKTVDIGESRGIPDFNMGTDWNAYVPVIQKNIERIMSMEPEEHCIFTHDKLRLTARYIKADTESHKLVIAVHGYRSRGLYELSGIAEMYHKHGYNILLVDNRAHGESEGRYAGFGILDRKDVLQWIHYVLGSIDPEAEIYLHGVSMGGAAVLMLSGLSLPPNVKAVIADCAFSNAEDILNRVFERKYGVKLTNLLRITNRICRRRAGYSFDDVSATESVAAAGVPVLFIHGAEDKLVPAEISRINYEACAADKKELCIIPDAGHAESFYQAPELYEKVVFGFIE